ncbi:maleylpyruvate isomerase N-terminal domain-containing protein [Nocardia sp. NPDC003963]
MPRDTGARPDYGVRQEYPGKFADERAEMIALLGELSEADRDTPTLCIGWRVRELVAHGRGTGFGIAVVAPPRPGRSVRPPAGHPPATRPDQGDTGRSATGRARRGERPDGGPHGGSVCGHARPEQRRRYARPDPFAHPWRYTKGLQFVATDFDWVKGYSPPVRGRGEALALAMVGRPVVLDEFEGEGVPELRRRCS